MEKTTGENKWDSGAATVDDNTANAMASASFAANPTIAEAASHKHQFPKTKRRKPRSRNASISRDSPSEEDVPPEAPNKPLTNYSISFRLERHYILRIAYKVPASIPVHERFSADDPSYVESGAPPLPKRYEKVVLPKNFHIYSGSNQFGERRKHRKTHGKVTFPVLSRMVSEAWKNAGQ